MKNLYRATLLILLAWILNQLSKGCNLVAHAKRELPPSDDDMQHEMNRGLIQMIQLFSTHGHSGFSASCAAACLEKLLRFKPLGPLTGEPHEWIELGYGDDMVAQNIRCGRVFKRADGTAYDINAVVFREPNGVTFTSGDSSRTITFPYTPTTIYVDVPECES